MKSRSLGVLYLTFLFSCLSAAAQDANPPHWPVCAELDAAAVWGIEEAGQSQQVSGDKLAAAYFLVMKARSACAEGRLSEAVAIYDDVSFD